MKIINLESGYPTVNEAKIKLLNILEKTNKKGEIYKLIHGFGSSGSGGKIKLMVVSNLKRLKNEGKITDFIPGEAIKFNLGYDLIIQKYKKVLTQDQDFKRANEGITYVII